MRLLLIPLILLPFLLQLYGLILWIPDIGTGMIPERALLTALWSIPLLPLSWALLGFQILVSPRYSCRRRWLWVLLMILLPFPAIPILTYDFFFKKHPLRTN